MASISGLTSELKMLRRKVDEILDATIKKHQSSKSEGDEEDLLDVLLRLKDDGTLESPITFHNIKAVILVTKLHKNRLFAQQIWRNF